MSYLVFSAHLNNTAKQGTELVRVLQKCMTLKKKSCLSQLKSGVYLVVLAFPLAVDASERIAIEAPKQSESREEKEQLRLSGPRGSGSGELSKAQEVVDFTETVAEDRRVLSSPNLLGTVQDIIGPSEQIELHKEKEQLRLGGPRGSGSGELSKAQEVVDFTEPVAEDLRVPSSPNLHGTSYQITKEEYLSSITAEKGNLFKLILSLRKLKVECDYVGQARRLLKKYIEQYTQQESDRKKKIESLLRKMLQPEDWFVGLAEERPHYFKAYKSYMRDLSTFIKKLKESAEFTPNRTIQMLIELLEAVVDQYNKFKTAYETCIPRGNEKEIATLLESKALLTGEGFLEGSFIFPTGWKRSFNSLYKEKLVTSYRLSQSQARLLSCKDGYGFTVKKNLAGANAVIAILQGEEGVHFKRETALGGLLPEMEMAAYWLSKILFGRGVAPTSLITIMNVNVKSDDHLSAKLDAPDGGKIRKKKDNLAKKPDLRKKMTDKKEGYLLQASQHVPGKMLLDFLKNPGTGSSKSGTGVVREPASEHFTEQMILSLLLNHADGKADNFIIGKEGVTAIDAGQTFEGDIAFHKDSGKSSMLVKNILFLLKDMEKMLNFSVMEKMKEVDSRLIIMKWLECLHYQNELYQHLHSTTYFDHVQKESSILPQGRKQDPNLSIELRPETIDDIYEKLETVKEFSKNPAFNHWVLFQKVDRVIAEYYLQVKRKKKHQPILATFKDKIYQKKHPKDFTFIEDVIGFATTLDAELRAQLEKKKSKKATPAVSVVELAGRELEKTDLNQVNLKEYLECAIRAFGRIVICPGWGLSPKLHPSWHAKDLLAKAMQVNCSPAVIDFLFECGLDPLAPTKDKRTAFFYICSGKYAHADQVRWIRQLKRWSTLYNIEFETILNGSLTADLPGDAFNTPLNLAVKAENTDLVMFLLQMGASSCDPEQLANFFNGKKITQNPQYVPLLLELFKKNREVLWRCALEAAVPKTDEQHEEIQDTKKAMRFLSEDIAHELLSKKSKLKSFDKTRKGRIVGRATFTLLPGMPVDLYFKQFPELPGLEEATGRLMRKLFGQGAPYTELIRFRDKPVQISQGITGTNLAQLFETDEEKVGDEKYDAEGLLKKINPSSVSAQILGAMLTNPEDGKPGNYVLEKDSVLPGYYQLWCVDNDHSFVKAFIREKPYSGLKSAVPVVQVKTILFCLAQMNDTVDKSIVDRTCSIDDPKKIIEEWLAELSPRHEAYEELFIATERFRLTEKQNSHIGINFKRGILFSLQHKLKRMRDFLATSPHATHMDLLKHLEPDLAGRYKKGFDDFPHSTWSRWLKVDAPFYKKKSRGAYMTLSKTGHILGSFALLPKKWNDADKAGIINPEQALKEFQNNVDDSAENCKEKILQYVEDKSSGSLNLVKLYELLPKNTEILTQLLRLLSEDPDKIKNWKMLFQAAKEISGLEDLILSKNSYITAPLVSVLDLKGLKKLHLKACENFGSEGVAHLADTAKVPSLEDLYLEDNPKLTKLGSSKQPLVFLRLSTLSLNGCSNLAKIYICAPLLTHFSIKDTKLNDTQMDALIRTHRLLKRVYCDGPLITDHELESGIPFITNRELRNWAPRIMPAEMLDQTSYKLFLVGTLALYDWKAEHFTTEDPDTEQELVNPLFYAGFRAEIGIKEPRDMDKALRLYLQSANKELTGWAEYRLGQLHMRENSGLPRDLKLADSYYKQAYEKLFDFLEYALNPYINNFGEPDVPEDIDAAKFFYERAAVFEAAEGIDGPATFILNFSRKQMSKEQLKLTNPVVVEGLLNIAIKMDTDWAHFNFAQCCEHGIGVEIDLEKAFKHYRIARKQRNHKAEERIKFCLEDLEKKALKKLLKTAHSGELLLIAARLNYRSARHNANIVAIKWRLKKEVSKKQ